MTNAVIDFVYEMDTAEEAPEIIDGYPNFQWIPVNPITDDDKSEYEHSKGVQEEISLGNKVDIPEPLEDKDVIKEMVKEEYHQEEPNTIS